MNLVVKVDIPTTDEEVITIFSSYTDELLKELTIGLYKCYRKGKGLSVVDAYEKVLLKIIVDKP